MSMITASNVDLSNCDREQIQFSGAVQPHGCMLVIEEPSLRILQVSANASNLLGLPIETLSKGSLEEALGTRAAAIAERVQHEALDNGPVHLGRLSGRRDELEASSQRLRSPQRRRDHIRVRGCAPWR